MEPTIQSGKHLALHAKRTGSRFEDVCLGDAEFDNVSLVRAKLHNINLSDITVTAVQIGGSTFKCIVLPPGSTGKQRPLRFEEADLNGTTLLNCDMSDVKIEKCNIHGMTIDSTLVTDMIEALNHKKK